MTKSSALPIGIRRSELTKLQAQFSYTWEEHSLYYLGITLRTPTSKIFKINYPKILSDLKREMSAIKSYELSLIGWMLLLPKLLYLFRTIKIFIPTAFFNNLNIALKRYIWQGKWAIISYDILTKPKNFGGVGLPVIQSYHKAALLEQLKAWFDLESGKLWVQIQKAMLNNCDLPTLFIAKTIGKPSHLFYFPSINASLGYGISFCFASN